MTCCWQPNIFCRFSVDCTCTNIDTSSHSFGTFAADQAIQIWVFGKIFEFQIHRATHRWYYDEKFHRFVQPGLWTTHLTFVQLHARKQLVEPAQFATRSTEQNQFARVLSVNGEILWSDAIRANVVNLKIARIIKCARARSVSIHALDIVD